MNVLLPIGVIAFLMFGRRRRRRPRLRALPRPVVQVVGGRFEVSSVDAWLELAAPTIEEATQAGIRGAEPILIAVMRKAIPRVAWPPHEDEPMYGQWRAMVRDVAEALHLEPEPEGPAKRGNLRIVS